MAVKSRQAKLSRRDPKIGAPCCSGGPRLQPS